MNNLFLVLFAVLMVAALGFMFFSLKSYKVNKSKSVRERLIALLLAIASVVCIGIGLKLGTKDMISSVLVNYSNNIAYESLSPEDKAGIFSATKELKNMPQDKRDEYLTAIIHYEIEKNMQLNGMSFEEAVSSTKSYLDINEVPYSEIEDYIKQ